MQTSTYTFTSSIACFRTPWRSTLTTPQIVAPAERMHIGRAPYGMGAKLAENIGHAADAFPVPLPRSLPTAPAAVPRWRMGRSRTSRQASVAHGMMWEQASEHGTV